MAQSVVYADLKFAAAPALTAPACPAATSEDDSPYENVPLGPVLVAPSPGHWPRRWRIQAGLLAATLLLLVATVALGACYWQVTRSLQDASQEHAAEQGRLSQEVSVREQSLEQMRLELAWARAELQRAWQEGNSSRVKLGIQDAELERARQELAGLQNEMQQVRGELRTSESTVSSLRACVNTDCCPSGWVLYRGKCLFVSLERKTWWDSRDDCRSKSAQLLVQGDWPSWTVPHFVLDWKAVYWIGEPYQNHHDKSDGVYDNLSKQRLVRYCARTFYDNISTSYCFAHFPWICEKPPDLSSPSETLFPLPAKG